MTRGYISIGSNIEKERNIHSALRELSLLFGGLVVSSTYETEPVGFDGATFHNLVVGFDSDLNVKTIAKQLRQIELDHGRTRGCKKFSSRTLDLDLILFGDLILNDDGLQIPRDEIERYAFVLEPLAEIAGDLRHPVSGIRYRDLWERFDKDGFAQKRVKRGWSSIE
ncbi:2-amino-4-hydroxy-6-hydroxymethyldihydropteridine diphosphokinase [Methylomicrobium agile]|uniref:2-amino-4-hydroxy-6- hydroxymethyldihydropteridine diphosphokinase n=1 Tax=Methylomicrobium agile TaxID=39774 RepID=UPI0004DF2BC0|nr:2-amino-4-hydroxy-6-hydroxymethyldihydropteridine diphosphokinase [Methylomicrobium agile]